MGLADGPYVEGVSTFRGPAYPNLCVIWRRPRNALIGKRDGRGLLVYGSLVCLFPRCSFICRLYLDILFHLLVPSWLKESPEPFEGIATAPPSVLLLGWVVGKGQGGLIGRVSSSQLLKLGWALETPGEFKKNKLKKKILMPVSPHYAQRVRFHRPAGRPGHLDVRNAAKFENLCQFSAVSPT